MRKVSWKQGMISFQFNLTNNLEQYSNQGWMFVCSVAIMQVTGQLSDEV